MAKELNLNSEIDYLGYWWLPGDKETQRAAKITYKPGASIKLDLLSDYKYVDGAATVSSSVPPRAVEVFLGKVMENAHWITLLENRRIHDFPGQNLVQCQYMPKYLLMGSPGLSPKDITLESTFKSVEVIFTSLRGWMKSHSLSSKNLKQGRYDVQEFNVHSVSLNSTVQTKITLQEMVETSESSVEKRQVRKNVICIKPRKPQSLEWFRDQIDNIRFLLAFLSGTQISCERFRAVPAKDNPDSYWVDVFHHIIPADEDEDNNLHMPFPYFVLRKRTEDVFRSWFERCENNRVPIVICIEMIHGQRRDLRFEFLSLVQALESYHQISTGTHNNSIGLTQRLKSVRNCLPESLQELVTIDDDFLNEVVHTRNYYTHYNPDKRERALKNFPLYDAVARLIPFVVVVLGRDLCISDELILKSFEQTMGLWRRPRIKEHEFLSI